MPSFFKAERKLCCSFSIALTALFASQVSKYSFTDSFFARDAKGFSDKVTITVRVSYLGTTVSDFKTLSLKYSSINLDVSNCPVTFLKETDAPLPEFALAISPETASLCKRNPTSAIKVEAINTDKVLHNNRFTDFFIYPPKTQSGFSFFA